jgi:hypothetical protein
LRLPSGVVVVMVERLAGKGNKTKARFFSICRAFIFLSLVCFGLSSCGDRRPKVPVFIFTQASPDGSTIDTLVPSDLVATKGSLAEVIAALPEEKSFQVVKFGRSVLQFQATELSSSEVFGEIATFKLPAAISQDDELWQERNLLIIPSGMIATAEPVSTDNTDNNENAETTEGNDPVAELAQPQSRQYTCPSGVQNLVLDNSRALFLDLGAKVDRLPSVAVSSVICLDIDHDQKPEIVAGLRLDNANRPASLDLAAWEQFLQLPSAQRQEHSMLVLLRRPDDAPDTWLVERLATHTRALSYTQDSVGSFALFSAHDLNGDDWLELAIVEIGLDTVEALVLTPVGKKWQWQSYYQSDRPLNVVQE